MSAAVEEDRVRSLVRGLVTPEYTQMRDDRVKRVVVDVLRSSDGDRSLIVMDFLEARCRSFAEEGAQVILGVVPVSDAGRA